MSWQVGSEPTIGELGEKLTLQRILPLLPRGEGVSVPPGDDAAVSTLSHAEVVTTCDLMVEGPDFRLDWSSPHDLGWKAVASNLADIAAMGAVPVGLIVAVAAPPSTLASTLEELARGIADGLAEMAPQCGVLGGDLSASRHLVVSVTVLGDLRGLSPVLRSGARPGDGVYLAGENGTSERGLRILQRVTEEAGGTLAPAVRDELRRDKREVAHHLAPTAPIQMGPAAAKAGARAMMDVSDGLLIDAERMAVASSVTIDLDQAFASDEPALMGGEDHGLLATFPDRSAIPEGFRRVGRVVEMIPGQPVLVGGEVARVARTGWDPYRDSSTVNT